MNEYLIIDNLEQNDLQEDSFDKFLWFVVR